MKHMKSSKNRRPVYAAIAVLVLVVVVFAGACLTGMCVAAGPSDEVPGQRDSVSREAALAACLTEKGAVMYGAYWCGHCNNQKEMFGDAVSIISYVECTEEKELCDAAGIRGYPTWIIDGNTYPGERPLEDLAGISGCEY
jgi:hypothetical protein